MCLSEYEWETHRDYELAVLDWVQRGSCFVERTPSGKLRRVDPLTIEPASTEEHPPATPPQAHAR